MTAGLLGALSTPVLKSLSDQIGRKFVVIGPLIHGSLVSFLLWFPNTLDMRWLLVGHAVEGLSGSLIATMSISQANITDISHSTD